MRLKDIVLNELLSLHHWRMSYNGEKIGLGYDEYCETQQLRYPEAYAKFGIGYAALYQATQDKRWLEWVNKCGQWLLKHTSQKSCYCWGLPFAYKCVPAEGPYLLTTAFCGEFFHKAFRVTGNIDYLHVSEKAADWIITNLERVDKEGRPFLSYSPYECLDYHIYNATSIAVKFFATLGETNSSYLEIADKFVKTLIALQRPDGSWFYSDSSHVIDCLHTAYVLEGLTAYARATLSSNDTDLKEAVQKGIRFLVSFFSKKGKAKWRYLLGLRDLKDADFRRAVKDMVLRVMGRVRFLNWAFRSRFPECYLWGYAAVLRVLALADVRYFKNMVRNIIYYLLTDLKSPDGCFWFNSANHKCYIRHQSHLFEAFAVILMEVMRCEML